jgi:hypothetical protein
VRLIAPAIIALLALSVTVSAQKVVAPEQTAPVPPTSQPPPPGARDSSSPQEPQARTGQQTTYPDQRGTDQIPLTVKVLPTPKSQADIDEEQRRADEHAANERGLTVATWVLAGFTLLLALIAGGQIGLFFWQLRLIRESLDDAGIAANAATVAATAATDQARELKRSADSTERSFTELERAYVFPSHSRIEGSEAIELFVEFRMRNLGRTPAIIKEFRVCFSKSDTLPLIPDYTDGQSQIFNWAIAGNAEGNTKIFTSPYAGRQFVYDYIRYLDIFGKEQFSRSASEWAPGGFEEGQTREAGGEPYNTWT